MAPPSTTGSRPGPTRTAGRASLTIASALALCAAATGCGSSPTKVAEPLASATPTVVLSTSTSSAVPSSTATDPNAAVLAQYATFWKAIPAAAAAAPAQRRVLLAPFAADPELSSLLNGMSSQDAKGQRIYGFDTPRATVKSIQPSAGAAVIRDCQDASDGGVADVSTGRHLTVGRARTLVVATMHLGDDGTWRVVFVSYPKSSKC